jgi:hypothetical protein
MKKVLFLVNDLPFFISHRLPIAIALKNAGINVQIASPAHKNLEEIKAKYLSGMGHHVVSLSRGGINPFKEFLTFFSLYFLFKKIKPDLLHLITIKPVLYGGIIARFAGVPRVVCAVSGLGAVFIKPQIKVIVLLILNKFIY